MICSSYIQVDYKEIIDLSCTRGHGQFDRPDLPYGPGKTMVNKLKVESAAEKARTVDFGFFCNFYVVFLCSFIHIKKSIMSKYRIFTIHNGEIFSIFEQGSIGKNGWF